MGYLPSIIKDRVEQALQSLRAIRPDVEAALASVNSLAELQLPTGRSGKGRGNLDDVRLMLGLIATKKHNETRLEPKVRLDCVDPDAARTLLDIAHAIRHDSDIGWRPGDDIRAERIVDSILVLAGRRPQRAYATIPGRHSEVFELCEGQIRHRWYPQDLTEPESAWSGWAEMECAPGTAIAATGSCDTIDVFVLTNGHVDYRRWQLSGDPAAPLRERDGAWLEWRALPRGGCKVVGPLAAISLDAKHRELFAYGENGESVHRWAWRDRWTNWRPFETD